jgi:hypothetical protein
MDIRRILLILATVVSLTSAWAQTELTENNPLDTLKAEIVIVDTLEERVDPKILLVEMNDFLAEKRKSEDDLFIPHLIYKENFHLSSPFNLNMQITKNGFSEIPFATSNIQTVQNNRSIYKTNYKRGNIFYNSWEYSLPAAITETYMGLGDNDMNNIAVSLMKGGIFGIPKFAMQLDFLGEKGIWQGNNNESSNNFHLHLSYDLNFAKIHFDNSIIDQTLPSGKDINGFLGYEMPKYSSSNKEDEYTFTIENKIIDLGFKVMRNDYKLDDYFVKTRDFMQVLAQKRFHSKNFEINLSYEFISEDILPKSDEIYATIDRSGSYHMFSLDQDANILGFNIGNTGYCRDKNNFQIDTELIKELFHGFSLCVEYNNLSTEYYRELFSTNLLNQTRSSIDGGIMISYPIIDTKFTYGKHYVNNLQSKFYDIHNSLHINIIKNIHLNYELWLRNEQLDYLFDNNPEILTYPEWQISDLLELNFLLKYNNAIKLGLKHIYHSDFSYYYDASETPITTDTNNYDAYLKIQLTDRFEISVDAVNITNNKTMFTNYPHPGTHFNFNWIFAN